MSQQDQDFLSEEIARMEDLEDLAKFLEWCETEEAKDTFERLRSEQAWQRRHEAGLRE